MNPFLLLILGLGAVLTACPLDLQPDDEKSRFDIGELYRETQLVFRNTTLTPPPINLARKFISKMTLGFSSSMNRGKQANGRTHGKNAARKRVASCAT